MIDHVIWYAADLQQGIDALEELLGVRAVKGGTHTGLGTHNALLSLGERCYLEIIAPDPQQAGGAWRDCLFKAAYPGLFHWALATPNLEGLAKTSANEFLQNRTVIEASRESATMGRLSWKLLMPDNRSYGALLPFLIDWGSSPHPAQGLLPGCQLKAIRIYGRNKTRTSTPFFNP